MCSSTERIRKVVIACGHTARIVALLNSRLFERLQLPIVTVVSNLSLEGLMFCTVYYFNTNCNHQDVGIQAILKLQGAFAIFSKFSLNHENVAVQAQALMAISNLLISGMLLVQHLISLIIF
jgi:fluoride ion exporter CrcB/FEX